ncbi:MAG TPA: hypothetical protein VH418_17850 [Solirubrobacteraceae bacterium]|jgi:hypothetical protein
MEHDPGGDPQSGDQPAVPQDEAWTPLPARRGLRGKNLFEDIPRDPEQGGEPEVAEDR